MSGEVIVKFSKKPVWERDVAIHEAGHAMAAWLGGAIKIEISLANEFRIAQLSNGTFADECRAVCAHDTPNTKRNILLSMVIGFAGVMAEHRLTGKNPRDLLLKSGRGDDIDIRQKMEEHQLAGATEEECQQLYEKAYSLSLELVERYWWEIIALAKLIEHFNFIPTSKISRLMEMFPSTSMKSNILKDLGA